MPELSAQLRCARAINEVLDGKSLRGASKQHLISRSYLSRRILGVRTREEYLQDRQKLSPAEEQGLVDWAITLHRLGYAPPLTYFRYVAERILEQKGEPAIVGKNWHTRFFARHPEIRAARSRRIDYKRANGATAENINIFFDRLEIPEIAAIPPEHSYNADEMGIMEGIGDNGIVVGESYRNCINVKHGGNRTWTTIFEGISASGVAIDPLIIYAGQSVQQQWFPDELDDRFKGWKFTHSENGWTNNKIALEWLTDVFIPKTAPRDPGQWRLLLMDGHASHCSSQFLSCCYINKIWVVFFPPHTSHVLQPADLGVYSSLKRGYRQKLTYLSRLYMNYHPGKQEFIMAYEMARKERLTKKNILAGFRATGIFPRCREKPLNNQWVFRDGSGGPPRPPPKDRAPKPPDLTAEAAGIHLDTPSNSRDLKNLEKQLANTEPLFAKPTARLLFRKMTKSLDASAVKLATIQARNQYLEAELEKAKPTKRRKVQPDPNKAFVDIQDVIKEKQKIWDTLTQEGGDDDDHESDPDYIDLPSESSLEDCINVAVS